MKKKFVALLLGLSSFCSLSRSNGINSFGNDCVNICWIGVYVRLVYNKGNTGTGCVTIGNISCINAWRTFLLVVTGSLLVLNDDDDDNVNTGSDGGTA